MIVVKKDGRRELFDEQKLLNGLIKAFEKRPVSYEKIQEMAQNIEDELRTRGETEITTEVIGETVMSHLENTDKIAYVRFASVYRDFQDEEEFLNEINSLIKKTL